MMSQRMDEVPNVNLSPQATCKQIWVSIVANLLQAMQGSVLALSSIILPQVIDNLDSNDISLTKEEGSWFASIYSVGYVYGSLLGGVQSDYLGRKTSLIIDSIVATTGIFLIANTKEFHFLLIGRLLCGQASGSGTVAIPIYISEISTPKVRSITGSFFVNFYFSGYSLTTILGSFIHWRTATNIIASCPILGGILLLTCHESPEWLLRNGKHQQADSSLNFFHGSNAEYEKEILLTHLRDTKNTNEPDKTFTGKVKDTLLDLWQPSFRRPFFVLFMIVPVFCQWNGVSIIAFYLVMFAKKIQKVINPFYAASIMTVLRTICANLSLVIVRTQPIRRIYITSVVFMGLGTSTIALYHHLQDLDLFHSLDTNERNILNWVPVVGFILYSLAASSGYFQVTYMIQGEILPPRVRSIGCGLLGFLDGVSTFLAAKVAPSMLNQVGTSAYFTYASFMCILMVVFAYFFLPETRGKRLDEIEDIFCKNEDFTHLNDSSVRRDDDTEC